MKRKRVNEIDPETYATQLKKRKLTFISPLPLGSTRSISTLEQVCKVFYLYITENNSLWKQLCKRDCESNCTVNLHTYDFFPKNRLEKDWKLLYRSCHANLTSFRDLLPNSQYNIGRCKYYSCLKQGEWVGSNLHGYGIEQTTFYYIEGNWKKGSVHGHAVAAWSDGSTYTGEWKSGFFCGQGKYVWNDGRVYEGGWKKNKASGYGVYLDKGEEWKGTWEDGKLLGCSDFDVTARNTTTTLLLDCNNEKPGTLSHKLLKVALSWWNHLFVYCSPNNLRV
eukprot:TRINITY_DN3060_c0_g1_i2.p1 TRINITY_DN3060_c0_g1~~TRINITY_DN3060_c0_g1_i2.p1  ORF type:complete len:279 (-),score=38.32 TRINITY_DN3060_c0_g1_i2:7-843(-)